MKRWSENTFLVSESIPLRTWRSIVMSPHDPAVVSVSFSLNIALREKNWSPDCFKYSSDSYCLTNTGKPMGDAGFCGQSWFYLCLMMRFSHLFSPMFLICSPFLVSLQIWGFFFHYESFVSFSSFYVLCYHHQEKLGLCVGVWVLGRVPYCLKTAGIKTNRFDFSVRLRFSIRDGAESVLCVFKCYALLWRRGRVT